MSVDGCCFDRLCVLVRPWPCRRCAAAAAACCREEATRAISDDGSERAAGLSWAKKHVKCLAVKRVSINQRLVLALVLNVLATGRHDDEIERDRHTLHVYQNDTHTLYRHRSRVLVDRPSTLHPLLTPGIRRRRMPGVIPGCATW